MRSSNDALLHRTAETRSSPERSARQSSASEKAPVARPSSLVKRKKRMLPRSRRLTYEQLQRHHHLENCAVSLPGKRKKKAENGPDKASKMVLNERWMQPFERRRLRARPRTPSRTNRSPCAKAQRRPPSHRPKNNGPRGCGCLYSYVSVCYSTWLQLCNDCYFFPRSL
jgi:hypothetical protein